MGVRRQGLLCARLRQLDSCPQKNSFLDTLARLFLSLSLGTCRGGRAWQVAFLVRLCKGIAVIATHVNKKASVRRFLFFFYRHLACKGQNCGGFALSRTKSSPTALAHRCVGMMTTAKPQTQQKQGTATAKTSTQRVRVLLFGSPFVEPPSRKHFPKKVKSRHERKQTRSYWCRPIGHYRWPNSIRRPTRAPK
jgi:hypothetical protein